MIRCGVYALAFCIACIEASNVAAASDVFSIACETEAPTRPYFVTFDLGSRSVVLETPPADIASYSGVNLYVGAVTSEVADQKINVALQVLEGTIYLVFDRDRKKLVWPGLDDGSMRPTLYHSCRQVPPRSVLDFRAREQAKDPISIRCDEAEAIYFTIDIATKRVISERGNSGRVFEGTVGTAKGDTIAITVQFDGKVHIAWDRSRGTITLEDGAGRPSTVMECREVPRRTMVIYHERLWKR